MAFWTSRLDRAAVEPRGGQPVSLAVPFIQEIRGWTDDQVVTGEIHSSERLSDLFNRREIITLHRPQVRRLGVLGFQVPAEERLEIDPFEFDLVVGGQLDPTQAGQRAARRIHKVRYPVIVSGRTFQVRGTLHLFPGHAPEHAAQRTNLLFLPLTNAIARHGGAVITDGHADIVLVNRYAIVDITQTTSGA